MRRFLVALIVILLSLHAEAGDFSQDFAVVFANSATEARYGRIPLDRSLLAQAIENAANAGARGVVVKFFLDQPRSEDGDRRLAAAISRIPVALQARMDDSEKFPNMLPDRFAIAGQQVATSVSGVSGWIPIAQFSEHAHAVCFVDFDSPPVPLLEKYRDKTVKSLLLCAAEMAEGRTAKKFSAKQFLIGAQGIALDAYSRVDINLRSEPPIGTLAFHDLIEGKIPADALKNKVVILAYDGPNIHTIKSAIGDIGAHRQFVLMLRDFYEQLAR